MTTSEVRRIEIDGYAGGLTFSYAHFLPGHPQCGRIHGHDAAISIRIEGIPADDEFGFIVDFSRVKKTIREIIKRLDHFLLVPEKSIHDPDEADPMLNVVNEGTTRTFLKSEVVGLDIQRSTAEELSGYALSEILLSDPTLPVSGITKIELGWFEGRGTSAWATWKREERR